MRARTGFNSLQVRYYFFCKIERKFIMKKVSIPYRYGFTKLQKIVGLEHLRFNSLQVRYYLEEAIVKVANEELFQFLIGTVLQFRIVDVNYDGNDCFNSLQVRYYKKQEEKNMDLREMKFQFLIGTVLQQKNCQNRRMKVVSIPYRYGITTVFSLFSGTVFFFSPQISLKSLSTSHFYYRKFP